MHSFSQKKSDTNLLKTLLNKLLDLRHFHANREFSYSLFIVFLNVVYLQILTVH